MAARPVPVSFAGAPLLRLRALQRLRGPTLNVRFADAMAFTGVVPEAVNGRLAMLGFVAAAGAEFGGGAGTPTQAAAPGSATAPLGGHALDSADWLSDPLARRRHHLGAGDRVRRAHRRDCCAPFGGVAHPRLGWLEGAGRWALHQCVPALLLSRISPAR